MEFEKGILKVLEIECCGVYTFETNIYGDGEGGFYAKDDLIKVWNFRGI